MQKNYYFYLHFHVRNQCRHCISADVHPEQPKRSPQHVATEPTARLRPPTGTDRHEDR